VSWSFYQSIKYKKNHKDQFLIYLILKNIESWNKKKSITQMNKKKDIRKQKQDVNLLDQPIFFKNQLRVMRSKKKKKV